MLCLMLASRISTYFAAAKKHGDKCHKVITLQKSAFAQIFHLKQRKILLVTKKTTAIMRAYFYVAFVFFAISYALLMPNVSLHRSLPVRLI